MKHFVVVMSVAELEPYLVRARYWLTVLFNPPLPQLEQALDTPEPATKPPANLSVGARRAWFDMMAVRMGQEQWEAVVARGLIPADWMARSHWLFPGIDAEHVGAKGSSSTTYQLRMLPHPGSPNVAIAMAANPGGIIAAEACLREFQRRYGVFEEKVLKEERIVWDFAKQRRLFNEWEFFSLEQALLPTPPEREFRGQMRYRIAWELEEGEVSSSDAAWAAHAVMLEWLSEQWQKRASEKKNFVSGANGSVFNKFKDRLVSSFENPLEPLLDLLRLGYAYGGAHPVFWLPTIYGPLP